MKNTEFLRFWRDVPLLPLGLAWRAWRLVLSPADRLRLLAPTLSPSGRPEGER